MIHKEKRVLRRDLKEETAESFTAEGVGQQKPDLPW